jgi:hypothetical protein
MTSSSAVVLVKPKRDMVPSISSPEQGKKKKGFQNPVRLGRFVRDGGIYPSVIDTKGGGSALKRFGRFGARLFLVALATSSGIGMHPEEGGAQEGPYAFQIRGGATAAVGAFGDGNQGWEKGSGGGTSLAMGLTIPFFRFVGGYLGFSQHRFACDEVICPEGKDWISTGFDAALRVVVGEGRVRPWLQAGLHTHRLEARVWEEGRGERLTSEGGGGYEAGGGILIQIGERNSLAPGVRYGLGNVPFLLQPNLKLRYLVFDLGLVLGF